MVWLRFITLGNLDHVSKDLPAEIAPKLAKHVERVKADERIVAYYAKHGVTSDLKPAT